MKVAKVATIARLAMTRFENSTSEWYPRAGRNAPGWQPGQCSQPRPDPVILTVAPEATITTSITALARESRRNVRVETANRRTRGNAVSIGLTVPTQFG
jgi:hypothetical protein